MKMYNIEKKLPGFTKNDGKEHLVISSEKIVDKFYTSSLQSILQPVFIE